jgi:Uma2 family endonuclease
MLLQLKELTVPPGNKVLLTNVKWANFEDILEDLGEERATRIAYENLTLEIMTPLPEQERSKEVISDLLKALLEELEREFITLGSTTFKNELMTAGIEPDNCFYIEHEASVRNKERLDFSVEPPPDLVLEIDVTSRTHPSIYEALGVPELWRFEKGKLKIYVLENGKYVEWDKSKIFPDLPLIEAIPEYRDRVKTDGRNKTMKAFRTWVKEQISEGN